MLVRGGSGRFGAGAALRIGLPRSLKEVLTICACSPLAPALGPTGARWSGADEGRTTAGGPFQREIHRRIVHNHGSCSSVTVCIPRQRGTVGTGTLGTGTLGTGSLGNLDTMRVL